MARRRAQRTLVETLEVFDRLGCRTEERQGLVATFVSRDERRIRARMAGQGRIFGGTYALELSTAEPVLPVTDGLRTRARGVVRHGGVSFRARSRDEAGKRLAAALDADEPLQRALARVHFDRVRVDPDGTAVIRHMGGSVVWMLFPPLVRPIPLVEEQARETLGAREAVATAADQPSTSGSARPGWSTLGCHSDLRPDGRQRRPDARLYG
ncbi:MAG: DUF3156 family protein, partial [Gaiellaceae bacterium]